MKHGVGIVGCGLIGHKRAAALARCKLAGCRLRACYDVEPSRAAALASEYPGALAVEDLAGMLAMPGVQIVIVATTHDALAAIAAQAARAGKHVLIEKPGARRASELDAVAAAAKRGGVAVRVGFNHRYHPALQKANKIVSSGQLGEMMFVRGRYGHGGRLGYEREWRANPERSGGGELIDQGIHLIDLARWFLGDFTHVQGSVHTYFWNMPAEDNAFLLLQTAGGQTAFLHASWTEWKNLFSFEISGRKGKLEVNGLGGSYGSERLTHYKMLPQMGPPQTLTFEYPKPDHSWELEFREFLADIRYGRAPVPGIADAQAALDVVERVYRLESG